MARFLYRSSIAFTIFSLTSCLTYVSAFAQTQSECTSIRFAHGATSKTIEGSAAPRFIDCYIFRTQADQDAHIQLSGAHISVSLPNIISGQKDIFFKTETKSYRILIQDLDLDQEVEPYGLTLSLVKASAHTDAIEGVWKYIFSCAGATGIYHDRCADGERDYFSLAVSRFGTKFCGSFQETAQLGNHVDDGDLNDWNIIPMGNDDYRIHFHLTGTVGEALVHVDGDKLYWRKVSERQHDEGQPSAWTMSPPGSIIMLRQGQHMSSDLACSK